MRVAVFGDVHAHAEALGRRARGGGRDGAEELWSLGDMIGGGPDPAYVVARTRERCRVALMGNHDYVATGAVEPGAARARVGVARAGARAAHRGRRRVDAHAPPRRAPPRRAVLARRPARPGVEFVGPRNAADCLAAQREPLGLVAHTHVAAAFQEGTRRPHKIVAGEPLELTGKWLLNPGAAAAGAGACWLLLDLDARTATWHRAPYDPAPANERARALGIGDRVLRRPAGRGRRVPERVGSEPRDATLLRALRDDVQPRFASLTDAPEGGVLLIGRFEVPERRARATSARARTDGAHDRPLVEPADVRADRLEAQRGAVRASGNSARSVVPTPTGLVRSRRPRSASTRSRAPPAAARRARRTRPAGKRGSPARRSPHGSPRASAPGGDRARARSRLPEADQRAQPEPLREAVHEM